MNAVILPTAAALAVSVVSWFFAGRNSKPVTEPDMSSANKLYADAEIEKNRKETERRLRDLEDRKNEEIEIIKASVVDKDILINELRRENAQIETLKGTINTLQTEIDNLAQSYETVAKTAATKDAALLKYESQIAEQVREIAINQRAKEEATLLQNEISRLRAFEVEAGELVSVQKELQRTKQELELLEIEGSNSISKADYGEVVRENEHLQREITHINTKGGTLQRRLQKEKESTRRLSNRISSMEEELNNEMDRVKSFIRDKRRDEQIDGRELREVERHTGTLKGLLRFLLGEYMECIAQGDEEDYRDSRDIFKDDDRGNIRKYSNSRDTRREGGDPFDEVNDPWNRRSDNEWDDAPDTYANPLRDRWS